MNVFIFSGILLAVGISMCYFREEGIGLTLMFISIVFGFGLFGFVIPTDSRLEKQENFSIVKTSNRVIIDTGDYFESFTNMKYRDITEDNVEVYKKIYSNAYGLEIYESETDIVIKFKE